MPQHLPSVEYLHKILRCEPDTGKLFWRERTPDMFSDVDPERRQAKCEQWNAKYANRPALYHLKDRHFVGRIDGTVHYAHRVLLAMYQNRWPTGKVRHLNKDTTDNRRKNLHEIPRPEIEIRQDEDGQGWTIGFKPRYTTRRPVLYTGR
jgi:hypothetical protein